MDIEKRNTSGGSERLQKWWQVVAQASKDLWVDNGTHWAASIAYFSIVSLFPLLVVVSVVASYFVDPDTAISQVVSMVEDVAPEEADEAREVMEWAFDTRRQIGIVSLLFLLWSGTRAFGALTRALNVARGTRHQYPFLKQRLIEVLVLLTIGSVFLLALSANIFLRYVIGELGVLPNDGTLIQILAGIAATVVLAFAFFLAYRFIPRPTIASGPAIAGAVTAALLFSFAQPVFVAYIREFTDMHMWYGPAASLMVLILWFWVAAVILLYGGEIATHAHAVLVEGKSKDELELEHSEMG